MARNEQENYKFFGNYRGEVIDNQDPLQAGRCKIRIHSVYDDVDDEFLPWAEYTDPFMQGQAGSGSSFTPDIGTRLWVFFENGDHMQPVYFAGAPSLADGPPNIITNDEEDPRGQIEYGKNRVIRTPGGQMIELDDTPGNSRVRIVHKSGTQVIMYDNGDMYEQVMGDLQRVVKGNLNETVNGNVIRQVVGSQTNSVNGEMKFESGGTAHFWSAGQVDINGTQVQLNNGAAGVVQVNPYEGFIPSEQVQLTPRNAAVLTDIASSHAAWDEEGEEKPAGWPAEESNPSVDQPTEINTAPGGAAPVIPDRGPVDENVYATRLSPSFTVKSLTLGAVYPHTIKAQNGLSVDDIVHNLKCLAVNILEPLKARYPNIRINSGFRSGTSGSQHNRGQGVDIQVPGASAAVYSDMAAWIVRNLPFDQFILEHGRSVWLHLSFNPNLSTQRGQRLTYWPRSSPQYKPGLKNHYDNGRVIN